MRHRGPRPPTATRRDRPKFLHHVLLARHPGAPLERQRSEGSHAVRCHRGVSDFLSARSPWLARHPTQHCKSRQRRERRITSPIEGLIGTFVLLALFLRILCTGLSTDKPIPRRHSRSNSPSAVARQLIPRVTLTCLPQTPCGYARPVGAGGKVKKLVKTFSELSDPCPSQIYSSGSTVNTWFGMLDRINIIDSISGAY